MNKVEIRRSVIKQREALTADKVRSLSEKAQCNFRRMEIFKNCRLLMVYMPIRNEVLTWQVVKESLDGGKKVAVPYVVKGQKKIIPSQIKNPSSDLIPGTYGILEPKPSAIKPVSPKDIDVVLVPGVAFDRSGNRLGYGGGYYDRFLPQCGSKTVFVGLCYQFQVLKDLSYLTESHDQKVHYLVTDREVLCTGTRN